MFDGILDKYPNLKVEIGGRCRALENPVPEEAILEDH